MKKLAILLFVVFGAANAAEVCFENDQNGVTCSSEPVHVRYICRNTGDNTMQCRFANDGKMPIGICLDVVKVCGRGEHVANVCSDVMHPGSTDAKVIVGFTPKVRWHEKCHGVEYRRKSFLR